jgi:hypothetical protein
MMHGVWLRQYIGTGLTSFILLHLPLSLYLHSLSYLHLPCHLHLPRYLYLPPYRSDRKLIDKGNIANDSLRFAYLWGHCFVHFALLGGNGNTSNKDSRQNKKTKEHQSPQSNIYCKVCHIPCPPSYLKDYLVDFMSTVFFMLNSYIQKRATSEVSRCEQRLECT